MLKNDVKTITFGKKYRRGENVAIIDALARFNRLTKDLANERTLLDWGRKALASARTMISFLALSDANNFGDVSAKLSVNVGRNIQGKNE